MQVSIRPYEGGDLDAIAGLWLESWRSTGLAVAQQGSEAAMRARVVEEFASGWTVFVAVGTGSRLVGFLALEPDIRRLDQIFVAPNAQRRGVGRALLDLAKRQMPTEI